MDILEIANADTLEKIAACMPTVREMRLVGNLNSHDDSHLRRTAIIAYVLWCQLGKSVLSEFPWLAGMLHDVGRLNDSADRLHGYRGVPVALRILESLADQGLISLNSTTFGKVCVTVGIHPLAQRHPEDFVEIVKDADKLELLRQGPRKLNPNRLVFPQSRELIAAVVKFQEGFNAV